MALGFIFGEGQKARTPEELKRMRATLEALRGNNRAPRNVGEGLTAIGEALAYRRDMADLEKGEAASKEAGAANMSKIADLVGGSTGYGGGGIPAGSTDIPGDMKAYGDAIAGIESGGRYDAIGPTHSKMGRALGKYQVMEANLGPWSEKYVGRRVTPEEFLANPDIQEKIFAGEFGSYVSKYGPEKAAQAWFGGEGGIGKVNRKDSLGTSIGSYGQKFMAALGNGGGAPAPAPVQTASLDPKAGIAQAMRGDPYGAIPAVDGRGEDQRSKFRQWNPDPIGGEAAGLSQIDPAMQRVIERAKQIAGTNFVLGSGVRDADMQKKAVDWGWSKTMDSDHMGGGAADLWPVDANGQIVFDPAKQQQIVAAMKQAATELGVDMEAGADWKRFKDMPHFGMTNQTPMNAPIPTARPGQDVQVASLDPSAGMPAMQPSAPQPMSPTQRIAQAFAPVQTENVTPQAGATLPNNDQTKRVLASLISPQPMGGEFAGIQQPETTAAIPQPQPVAPQPSAEPFPGVQVAGVGGAAGRTAPLNGQGGQFPPAPGQASQGAFPPAPAMPGQGLDLPTLIQLASDPNTPELGQFIVQQLLKQRLTPPDPMDALNQQKTQLEIQKAQRDLETPKPGFRQATPEEAAAYGSPAGQFGPDGRFYPVNPPSGTNLSVDPTTGAVTFQQGSGVKPLTESQSKLTLFQSLQTETQPVLLDLEKQFDPANIADATARSTPIAGNFFQSEQGQIYQSAATAWAEGALRIATGAAATPEEMERTKKAYFAQPGDTPNTIAFKAQMREMYNRAINRSLGKETSGALPKPGDFAKTFKGGGQNSGDVPSPQTQEEFDALPSGSIYVDPEDGKQYRKP